MTGYVLLGLIGSAFIALTTAFVRSVREQLGRRRDRQSDHAFSKGEGSIPESPAYAWTKAIMGELRHHLDAVDEGLERIDQVLGSEHKDGGAVFIGLRDLHEALLAARGATVGVLAAVEQRPRAKEPEVLMAVAGDTASRAVSPEQAERLCAAFCELRELRDDLGLGIAGFYAALSEKNRQRQAAQAAKAMRQAVRTLDAAIEALLAFEHALVEERTE